MGMVWSFRRVFYHSENGKICEKCVKFVALSKSAKRSGARAGPYDRRRGGRWRPYQWNLPVVARLEIVYVVRSLSGCYGSIPLANGFDDFLDVIILDNSLGEIDNM